MNAIQAGILPLISSAGRYLFFSIADAAALPTALNALRAREDEGSLVIGVGLSLTEALGRSIPDLKDFPATAAAGHDVPLTPAALWCWLRGEDRGEILLRAYVLEQALAPAFKLDCAVDGFRYGRDQDLSGYMDGTANPRGEAAARTVTVAGQGSGLDGGSFVAVQQWQHDFTALGQFPEPELDNMVGRRKRDNVELADAPEYSHVKRTDQESFAPAAHTLRRSMPWSGEHGAGLLFVSFGRDFAGFEAQWQRMTGQEDGIVDALFRFSHPLRSAYFWCPPIRGGRLDLSALGFTD